MCNPLFCSISSVLISVPRPAKFVATIISPGCIFSTSRYWSILFMVYSFIALNLYISLSFCEITVASSIVSQITNISRPLFDSLIAEKQTSSIHVSLLGDIVDGNSRYCFWRECGIFA